jgi:hypothetical protein
MSRTFKAYAGGTLEAREVPDEQAQTAGIMDSVLEEPLLWRWDAEHVPGAVFAITRFNVRVLVRQDGVVSLRQAR